MNKLEDMLDIQAEGKTTFRELTKWYVEIEETRCRAEGITSFRRKQDCLNSFNAVFGDTIVRDTTLADLENYKLKRLTEGISKRTVDYQLGEVKRMMKAAWHSNKISGRTWRIFDNTKKLLKAGANVRRRVMEPEEYVVLDKNLGKHQKALWKLALFSGMRPGELIPINKSNKAEGTRGLAWDRVDFKNRMIVLEAEDTKTGEARNITVTDEIKEILHSIPRDITCNHVFTYRGVSLGDIRGGAELVKMRRYRLE